MTRCIVSWDKLADLDDPIRNLNSASAALVLIHAEMTKLAERAMEFMVVKIGEDARKLAHLYESLRERIVSDRPEAVPPPSLTGDDAA